MSNIYSNRVYKIYAEHLQRVQSGAPLAQEESLAYTQWLALIDRFAKPTSEYHVGMSLESYNKYDQGYTYVLSEPIGQNFKEDFKPVYTPQEMLMLGVFEGKYLNDDIFEFPKEWFIQAQVSLLAPNIQKNAMNIASRQALLTWQEKFWILTDKKGWFQWYCRYYLGRRLGAEDDTQIKRWKAFVRHAGQIKSNCMPFDLNCRPRQRQALLQWAHEYTI